MEKRNDRVYQGNSAYRKMIQRRQENRRFAVAGFVVAIVFVACVIYNIASSDSKHVPHDGPVIEMPLNAEPSSEHPLVQYARGVPSMEEMDAKIDGSSSDR